MAGIVLINIEEGLKRVLNNEKLYVKLLNKFKADPNFDELKTALAAGDLEKAQINAHTLKGLSANLALTELFNQTLELETQIKAGSVNPNQLPIVIDIYAQTMAEIDKVTEQYG